MNDNEDTKQRRRLDFVEPTVDLRESKYNKCYKVNRSRILGKLQSIVFLTF